MQMISMPGTLYFLGEEDIKTGERSTYCKIGIVREAEGRDAKDRLLEHQTGNPRKLFVIQELQMPAVEYIETNLHYLFARNRVLGEWMQFTPDKLQTVIAKAHELKIEIEANFPDMKKAEELKKTISNGSKLVPNKDSQYWHQEILTFKIIISTCNKVLAKYDEYLYVAIDKGVSTPGVAKILKRVGVKKFDEKLFASQYPKLFKLYSGSQLKILGSFRIDAAKNWSSDNLVLQSEQIKLIADFRQMLENANHTLDTGFALHEKHLAVLEVLQYAEWRKDIADIKLRVLTGSAEGIEGICTWKRVEKVTTTFDKSKVQFEHPDEYSNCVIDGATTEVLIVDPKMAGAINDN